MNKPIEREEVEREEAIERLLTLAIKVAGKLFSSNGPLSVLAANDIVAIDPAVIGAIENVVTDMLLKTYPKPNDDMVMLFKRIESAVKWVEEAVECPC